MEPVINAISFPMVGDSKMLRMAAESGGISHKSQDIKKYSNLFISRAAMNIIGKKFPYESIVNSEMLASYEAVLTEALRAGEVPLGFSLSLLKRRKNFDKSDEDVKESDIHNSKSLWRKWGDVKTMIKKTFIPIYKSIVPTPGAIPTEEQLEAVLQAIRAAEERTTTRAARKEMAAYTPIFSDSLDMEDRLLNTAPPPVPKLKKVNSNWTPTEWLTFMKLGPPAGPDFAKAFGAKKLRGKKRKNGCDSDGTDLDGPSSQSCSSGMSGSSSSDSKFDVGLVPFDEDEAHRRPSKITSKYLSKADLNGNLKDAKKQRELAAAELAIYRYNVALQARKDRIEEIKELINLEESSPEKKIYSADLKTLLSTPPPVAPDNLPAPVSLQVESDSDDSGEDE